MVNSHTLYQAKLGGHCRDRAHVGIKRFRAALDGAFLYNNDTMTTPIKTNADCNNHFGFREPEMTPCTNANGLPANAPIGIDASVNLLLHTWIA